MTVTVILPRRFGRSHRRQAFKPLWNLESRPGHPYIKTVTMPPRLPTTILSSSKPFVSTLPQFLLPSLIAQTRSASILSSLCDNPASYKKPIRRGRGPSSGKGKTSGRGHKGQRQHGKVPRDFNGGQTPLEVVHGVRGFKNAYV